MKGIYVLIIRIDTSTNVKIGALGTISFKKGTYAYVGSAQNNLESRVKRHLSDDKKLFWHIDYLLANKAAKIVNVYYTIGDKTEECRIAGLMAKKTQSILGFGCSDCRCNSHFFFGKDFRFLNESMQSLQV